MIAGVGGSLISRPCLLSVYLFFYFKKHLIISYLFSDWASSLEPFTKCGRVWRFQWGGQPTHRGGWLWGQRQQIFQVCRGKAKNVGTEKGRYDATGKKVKKKKQEQCKAAVTSVRSDFCVFGTTAPLIWMGCLSCKKCTKEAQVPDFSTEPGTFFMHVFAVVFKHYVAQKLPRNRTVILNGVQTYVMCLLWF